MSNERFVAQYVTGCHAEGHYPFMWKAIIDRYNIKSMIDVGSNEGYALEFFKNNNVEIRGVEFWKPAIDICAKRGLDRYVIENDYEVSSYIPEKDFDMCWSHEFIEHIDEQCKQNFLDTFKKCKIVFMTHAIPGQAGTHHVNCQNSNYWMKVMDESGFDFLVNDTMWARSLAKEDSKADYRGFNFFLQSGLVFRRK